MATNILDSDVAFPETVYIVATGPEAEQVHKAIPRDAFIIAVNGAIDYKLPCAPAIWLMGDPAVKEKPYYKKHMDRLRESSHPVSAKDIRAGGSTVPVISEILEDVNTRWIELVYKPTTGGLQEAGALRKSDKTLRIGATIAGVALQLAYYLGAKKIIIVGVRLFGDRYFDGSKHTDPDRKEKAWTENQRAWDWLVNILKKNGCDVIHLRDRLGIKTLDADAPIVPRETYNPSVALMTFGFNPVFTKHAIFNAAIQDYPNKSLYLITQNREQPTVKHDLPFKVVQINVNGKWPGLWIHKLMEFLRVVSEDYIAIFDEDDYFEPAYISDCVKAVQESGADIAWNTESVFVTRREIARDDYRIAIGTALIRRDVLIKAAKRMWLERYESKWKPGAVGVTDKVIGAGDAELYRILIEDVEGIKVQNLDEFIYGARIVKHEGVRWYVYHRNANSCGGRRDEDCIDYFIPPLWYAGSVFEGLRTQQRNAQVRK